MECEAGASVAIGHHRSFSLVNSIHIERVACTVIAACATTATNAVAAADDDAASKRHLYKPFWNIIACATIEMLLSCCCFCVVVFTFRTTCTSHFVSYSNIVEYVFCRSLSLSSYCKPQYPDNPYSAPLSVCLCIPSSFFFCLFVSSNRLSARRLFYPICLPPSHPCQNNQISPGLCERLLSAQMAKLPTHYFFENFCVRASV